MLDAQRAKFWLFSILLACAFLAPVGVAADDDTDRVVVFGTSLSDPGNAFQITGRNLRPPSYGMDALTDPLDLRIPDLPYAGGGNHFSNGSTWIEQLARRLDAERSVRPAFVRSRGGSANYAVGGTRARDGVAGEISLSMQVSAYLRDRGRFVSGDSLFVIEMGANDIRDAFETALGVLQEGGTLNDALAAGSMVIQQAIGSIAYHIGVLRQNGAEHFLVWGAPDLSLTPAVQRLDSFASGASTLAALFSAGFDANLKAVLAEQPGGSVVILDVYNLLHQIASEPGEFGLTDVSTPCIQPNEPPFRCAHPDRFLFWDGIHPTRAAHGILARKAANALREAFEMGEHDD